MRRLLLTLAATIISFAAFAQERQGVGYPTVAAALEALKAKGDVNISVQGGWTIVDDKPANTIWSFTPSNHPAHPAVVKRALFSRDGRVGIEMTALCQAGKAACDTLMEEFKELNVRMGEAMSAKGVGSQRIQAPEIDVQGPGNEALAEAPKSADGQWHPVTAQVQRAELQSNAYFAAKDGRRYKEAYELLSPAAKQITPFERWRSDAETFNARMGQVLHRDIKKISWYKNPPQAPPGTYAAVDFSGRFTNANIHCGYLVWFERGDGSFLLVREEENFIDKATEQKMKPDDLKKVRAQFGCNG